MFAPQWEIPSIALMVTAEAAKVNSACKSASGKMGSCSKEGQFRNELETTSRCLTLLLSQTHDLPINLGQSA